MKWENYVTASENVLGSPQVPSSLEIITLIKKVNPTKLMLSETDRERGYQLKNRLQSLLLEHYGDSFYLIPHPASPNIILIKHRMLPSIDACHSDLTALSREAIERVETAAPLYPEREESKRNREKSLRARGHRQTGAALSAKHALKKAQDLMEQYDYAAAEEVLAGFQIQGGEDLRFLRRAAGIMLYEIGAYQRCIDTLLKQPKNVLKDKGIRELLAVAYHHNGSLPEARAILDGLYPAELGFEALFAYADISFKDANLSAALELVKIARGKEGFLRGLDALQQEIESAMLAQAEPLAQMAQAALRSAAVEEARQLAREALDLYPNCQQARAVISAVKAQTNEALLAELWARLESEQSGERRIALLDTLLERDKERRDTVAKLLAEEKELQRRRLFDDQLESLRGLVSHESWPECFDLVTSLMKQPEFSARARDVLALSPFFPVLHENRRLHSAAERCAKDLWLRMVKVKTALAAGNAEGCFQSFKEFKPWFSAWPELKEDYLLLLQGEQEKARAEIAALIAQSEAPECPASEVRCVLGRLRRRMSVLPVEERRELARIMEGRLARLIPEQDPDQPLAEYREALQIGNGEKAAHLRHEIADIAAREAVEAEFAEPFHIAWEPLTLEMSDELPIDLVTPPPLILAFSGEQKFFLKDGPDSYVMIDFAAQAACRMTSPVFSQTHFLDCTQNDIFLFGEKKGEREVGDRLWRAELSIERAAFTASFDMKQRFEVEEGFELEAVFASSERDTDYYLLLKRAESRGPWKVIKTRLAPKGTMLTLQIGNRKELKMWRWGSRPDRFLIQGEGDNWQVNRNLSVKAHVRAKSKIYKFDSANSFLYCLEDKWLIQRDSELKFVKCYDRSISLGLYEPERVHGFSSSTDTMLIVLGDGRTQSFYNVSNNKFSSKIRSGRVIPSKRDGKWYCFDYSRAEKKLWLRDITSDIHTELEWREVIIPQKNRKKMLKPMLWFHRDHNFLYRPGEWGPGEPTAGGVKKKR